MSCVENNCVGLDFLVYIKVEKLQFDLNVKQRCDALSYIFCWFLAKCKFQDL